MNGCRAMKNPSIQYNNKLDKNGKKKGTRIVIVNFGYGWYDGEYYCYLLLIVTTESR